jgi:hypothetical protein
MMSTIMQIITNSKSKAAIMALSSPPSTFHLADGSEFFSFEAFFEVRSLSLSWLGPPSLTHFQPIPSTPPPLKL